MSHFRFVAVAALSASSLTLIGCGGSSDSTVVTTTPPPVVVEPPVVTRSPSAARLWNEVLLEGIRNDYARPTVHARNLFHSSAAMYDAWAVFDDTANTYLLGSQVAGFDCALGDINVPASAQEAYDAREQVLSYAVYRIIEHRFAKSPGVEHINELAQGLMTELGFDVNIVETEDKSNWSELGNYLGQCYIDYGLQDGSKEDIAYASIAYRPVNPPLAPHLPGNPSIEDHNRWQSLTLTTYIDQSGNEIDEEIKFLGPEWGQVTPFSLKASDYTVYTRDNFDYLVYHDPGTPPLLGQALASEYQWGFGLVAQWSSHLDPSDGVMIDISPASLGNISQYPQTFEQHRQFYNATLGGDASVGYEQNPVTGMPYEPQMVPRGDYTRVLAEFWADGPDSETPPGHWYVLLNEAVNDHPDFVKKFEGQGEELDDLEWDVKAYFALGGTMHDSAISAWGIKGWYDYIRPVSAIRLMADLGQSSDQSAASYHPDGIALESGKIELVTASDPLAGEAGEHVGKIKLFAWKGPDYIEDPKTDQAGVGWILAENWWPYQRPSFVTPPFAGYVSGHSTYSRAAAELLTAMTGDAYFPGGMSGFTITANEFLVFEQGPSVDMTLQWATYRDASDQCSLSRIWGGIHPPADDIPGRLIGAKIGVDAFNVAKQYFTGNN